MRGRPGRSRGGSGGPGGRGRPRRQRRGARLVTGRGAGGRRWTG